MKKRFQKKSVWKIVFSLFSMLLLLTNCQDEEMHLDEKNSSIKQEKLVPSLEEAQLYFENFNSNVASNTQHKNSNSKRQNFFVHWKKSRVMEFNPELETQMLYTPILFDKKNLRIKSFLASFKNDKPQITSRIFSIMYHEEHTNEALSGYIFEKDLDGNVQRIYNYEKGLLQSFYTVSEKSGKSKVAAKADDCELSDADWLIIMEMLEASGGGTFTLLDCVEIVSGGDDPNNYEYLDDYNQTVYFPISLSGGSNSTGTSSTIESNDPVSTDQWWYEETNIDPMVNEISITLIEYLPPLTSEQRSFINNPVNDETNIQILNFLQANGHTAEAQGFALNAIDAFIDGGEVDFETWTINGQPNCPEGKEYNPVTEECECPEGYTEDRNGNCVEKPCVGDPVVNPRIAAQVNSGIQGGLHDTCARKDKSYSCKGIKGRKIHEGVDILNPYGAPIFAIAGGTATMHEQRNDDGELIGAGYYVVVISNINGVTIRNLYFHLQPNNRVTGIVEAGDIIGYQGDSGNLANAISQGQVASHVHVKTQVNGEKSNPLDQFNTTIDPESGLVTNPCQQ